MSDEKNPWAGVSWTSQTYQKELPDNIGIYRELLEQYGRVPAKEVDAHLHTVRDKAWAVARFPCVGMWSFTDLRCVQDPIFETVVSRLRDASSRDILLDVGCGLGQVLRWLASQGVDPSRLYGTDLLSAYLDLGFELFRDRDRFPADHFLQADLLKPDMGKVAALEEKVTVVHAANFFHLFAWEQQTRVAAKLVKLLRPDAEDAMVFGRQLGSASSGDMKTPKGDVRWLHNEESMQRLWDEVGEETGTRWRVEVKLLKKLPFLIPGYPEDTHYIGFTVCRV